MALVKLKPTSPGRRHAVKVVNKELHKGKPWAALVEKKNRINGRNNDGHITCRHKGGGAKRHYRLIDFKRQKTVSPPALNASNTIQPLGQHRSRLLCGRRTPLHHCPEGPCCRPGNHERCGIPDQGRNTLPLRNIPVGSTIHCIELLPGKGAQLVRAAGAFAQLVAREGEYAQIRLRSGEVRRVLIECRATIGTVGNEENSLRELGKAGAKRWRGIRPTVRGVAMNRWITRTVVAKARPVPVARCYAVGPAHEGLSYPQQQAHRLDDRVAP